MRTLILGEPPAVISSLISDRQRLGLDTHDELWEGDYHMAPAANSGHGYTQILLARALGPAADAAGLFVTVEFNLGDPQNFRVPDLGFQRTLPTETWVPTAVIVVEVRSPDDESYEKFGHYHDHGVEEILITDLTTHEVQWYHRSDSGFERCDTSALLRVDGAAVRAALNW